MQFEIGVEAQRRGDCRTALEHYLASNRLVYNKNVVFNIGACYENIGRFADAFRYYSDYLDEELADSDRAEAQRALARVRPRVALIRIESTPPGASIFLERTDLGERGQTPRTLAVEPGPHTVILELDGHEGASAQVQARLGDEAQVTLSLTAILGTVEVVGEPAGAEIRLDDESSPILGTVPGHVQATPGQHVLIVSSPGHQSARVDVDVRPRASVQRNVRLELQTGSVLVDAQERGALIEVDGNAMGFTPTVLQRVPAGTHTVRIARSGFRPFEDTITVRPNEQTAVQVRLRLQQEVTAASRQAESVYDAPASVSIIPQEELRAFAFQTIWDALGGVRGIYQSNDTSYPSLGFRGFSQPQDYGNRVLVLNDGHTMNDDLLGSSYVGFDARADLLDVERIEVVRGPGSTLYGTNAFFGVINLVTRDRDTFLRPHASIATENVSMARLRVGGGHRFARDAGLWVSASGVLAQGEDLYLPDVTTAADGYVRGADSFYAGGGALRAWWGDFTLQSFFHRRGKRFPTGAFGSLVGDPRAVTTDSRGFTELRWEPRFSDEVSFVARVYGDYYGYDGVYPYDAADGGPTRDSWNGLWMGGEARAILRPVSWLSITAGSEVRGSLMADLRSGNDEDADPSTPAIDPYLNEAHPFFVAGGYALAELRPVEQFIATAGLRYDYVSTFADGAFSPRASVLVRPWSTGTFKLMGGGAFRAPSVYELYYNDNGVSQIAPASLRPERIWTMELEYTQRIDDEISVVGSVFYNYIDSLITTALVPGPMGGDVLQYTNSTDPTQTFGAEVEVRREWRQGWMVSGSYAFQRTRRTDLFQEGNPATTDTDFRLSNSPEHLFAFRAAAPIVSEVATLALRLRLESPRLGFALNMDGSTRFVQGEVPVFADLILSGEIREIGLGYAVGVRNMFDWRIQYPGGEDLLPLTFVPQPGRTFFFQTTLTL